MTIKMTILTHRPSVPLTRFSFCWWRHNRLLMTPQWPDICDAITWMVMSNSLDIDFIHGDIHSRSCKKIFFFPFSEMLKVTHNSKNGFQSLVKTEPRSESTSMKFSWSVPKSWTLCPGVSMIIIDSSPKWSNSHKNINSNHSCTICDCLSCSLSLVPG